MALGHQEQFTLEAVRGANVIDGRQVVPTQSSLCSFCGALKLEDESNFKCCIAGNVVVEPFRVPLSDLIRLFGDARFLQHTRAYNNVFAFTSLGASATKNFRVDESVTISAACTPSGCRAPRAIG